MKIKKGYVKIKSIDGWVVAVVGEESKKNKIMLELNDTASEIWDFLAKGISTEAIADALCEKYTLSKEHAQKSVANVINTLNDAGVLE